MFGVFSELFSSHLKLNTQYLEDIQGNMAQMNLVSETAIYASVVCLSSAFLISFFKFSLTPESTSQDKKKMGVTTMPNGPTPLPIVGNLFYFAKMLKDADAELLKLGEKYGALCMMWFSSNPILIVSKANDIKQLLDKKGSIYSDRPAQSSFREQAWPWRLVTTGVGERFRLLRRVYNNLLGPQQSAGFNKYQDYEAKMMMRDLLDVPEGFLAHTERFAMSVIFSAVYGVRLVQLDHPTMVEFYHVWEDMLKYFQPGTLLLDYFPILEQLPLWMQPWRKLAASLRTRESALHVAFLRTLKKQVEAGSEPECFGSELVKIQEAEDIDDDKAINILAMLIGAGADTTSSVLQSFFKVMALNPQALRNAQEELDTVVGSSRLPTWEDEQNLPYIRALIKEVHRWAPIGSLGVPHATSDSDVYQKQYIPKGTIVFPNLTTLNRDPERYDDPEAFKPERFLGDDLNASASANHPDFKRRDHFHYGFGRRLCQGIFVAEASLYIVISRVLWGFDIAPEKGAPRLDLNDKIAGLVTKPKPYRVRIVPRSPAHKKVIEDSAAMAQTDILDFDSVELLS